MGKRRPKTWLALMIERQGWRRARTCMSFAMEWALVMRELGRVPSVDEFADWWGMPRSTAFARQATWREMFPEFATPTEFYAAAGVDPLTDALDTPGLMTQRAALA